MINLMEGQIGAISSIGNGHGKSSNGTQCGELGPIGNGEILAQ